MDLGLKIKKINDLLEKNANQTLQESDLTFSQHHVLLFLKHQENGTAKLKDVEKHFNVAQATMAGIVVRLESKGLIQSSVSEEDRRIKVLKLTDSGRDLLHESHIRMKKGEEILVSGLNDEQIESLNNMLDVIYSTLQMKWADGETVRNNSEGKEKLC